MYIKHNWIKNACNLCFHVVIELEQNFALSIVMAVIWLYQLIPELKVFLYLVMLLSNDNEDIDIL